MSPAIQPVIALVGSDRFLRQQALSALLKGLDDELSSFGPTRVEGDRVELADVLDGVRTPSLLGGRSVVFVDDADGFVSKHRARLESYCSVPSKSGCLILGVDSLPRNTRLYKIINEHGTIVVCDAPKGRAFLCWITNHASNEVGKTVRESAAQRLRDELGESPGAIDAELRKLAAYVGDRRDITAADVDALTAHTREETVFAITDAVASGVARTALNHWQMVLSTDRAAIGRALGGLAWGVRRLLEARRDLDEGAGLGEIAGRLRTESGLLRKRLERLSESKLELQLDDLLSIDVAVKTGATTLETAIEKFIITHSHGPATPMQRAGAEA